MYMVKTVDGARYILYELSNLKWAWHKGLYFVRPDWELGFIEYIENNELLKPLRQQGNIIGLLIAEATLFTW